MRKLTGVFILAAILVGATPLFPMEYLIGARGGYFIWDHYIKDIGPQNLKDVGDGDGVLYGPILSALFTPDLSLSASGLFGRQKADDEVYDKLTQADNSLIFFNTTTSFSFTTDRIDLDGALSYRLFEYFRVFAGYKYWRLKTTYNSQAIATTLSDLFQRAQINNLGIRQYFHGPAAGVGFSLPLGEKFFVAANASAIYMRGVFKLRSRMQYHWDSASPRFSNPPSGTREDMRLYGFNLEPSVGVNPGEGLPIVTLGFRYQWNRLQFRGLSSFAKERRFNEDWMNDRLYGIFLSIMYQI